MPKPQGEVRNIDPKDIRADSWTFHGMIYKHFDRIADVGTMAGSAGLQGKNEIQGFETSIRILHALLFPFVDPEYDELKSGVEKWLKDHRHFLNSSDKRYEYLNVLCTWLKYIVNQFSRVNLLPSSRRNVDFVEADDGIMPASWYLTKAELGLDNKAKLEKKDQEALDKVVDEVEEDPELLK